MGQRSYVDGSDLEGRGNMYRKYMVYLDDGEGVYKVAIAAICEESAALSCKGNGEVVAVKDVTDEYPIVCDKVAEALDKSGFGQIEIDYICRALREFGIAE